MVQKRCRGEGVVYLSERLDDRRALIAVIMLSVWPELIVGACVCVCGEGGCCAKRRALSDLRSLALSTAH